jgi:hypothetical protein
MARTRTNIAKRKEIRKLESMRDELMTKRDNVTRQLAEVRASLKKRRKQS